MCAYTREGMSLCAWVRASVWVGGCGCKRAGVRLRACSLTYPAWHAQAPYSLRPLWLHLIFRHYITKGAIFGGGGKSLNIKYVFWLSLPLLFETFLFVTRNQRGSVVNVKMFSSKAPVFCRILLKLEFSRRIFEKSQISNFIKIRPVGAELLHADKRTDMTKLTVAFRSFPNAPKKKFF
jgi:hypothetical protein